MQVSKQNDSFRLNEFDSLSLGVKKSMLFSKHGKSVWLLDVKNATKHDVVRIVSYSGSITLIEIVDPENNIALVYHVSSPYLANQYNQSGRYLGACFIGAALINGEDFCFLDGSSLFNRIYRVERIEILEDHGEEILKRNKMFLSLEFNFGNAGGGEVF